MRTLFIQFDPSEHASAAGFANALSSAFDFVEVPDDVLADAAASALAKVSGGYTHLAAVSSMRSKDVMARLAALLSASMVTDAIAVEAPNRFVRPIVAGTVLATVETLVDPVVVTFRPGGFAPSETRPDGKLSLEVKASQAVRTSAQVRGGSRPDLTQAKRIVSGGRPLKDAETFEKIIGGLADKLGGAVGATRAAVDSGIAPNELQVGQTGKIVAPDLYIAAGISGSTQHMAGIKDSKCIVAINKDPDAPIFEVADFGLVADLYDAVPELTSKV